MLNYIYIYILFSAIYIPFLVLSIVIIKLLSTLGSLVFLPVWLVYFYSHLFTSRFLSSRYCRFLELRKCRCTTGGLSCVLTMIKNDVDVYVIIDEHDKFVCVVYLCIDVFIFILVVVVIIISSTNASNVTPSG